MLDQAGDADCIALPPRLCHACDAAIHVLWENTLGSMCWQVWSVHVPINCKTTETVAEKIAMYSCLQYDATTLRQWISSKILL